MTKLPIAVCLDDRVIEHFPFIIGRASTSKPIHEATSSNALFPDPMVSRRHASVTLRGNRWYLKDLESTCGTQVDDVKVSGEVELSPGSVISLRGTSKLNLTFKPVILLRFLGHRNLDLKATRNVIRDLKDADISFSQVGSEALLRAMTGTSSTESVPFEAGAGPESDYEMLQEFLRFDLNGWRKYPVMLNPPLSGWTLSDVFAHAEALVAHNNHEHAKSTLSKRSRSLDESSEAESTDSYRIHNNTRAAHDLAHAVIDLVENESEHGSKSDTESNELERSNASSGEILLGPSVFTHTLPPDGGISAEVDSAEISVADSEDTRPAREESNHLDRNETTSSSNTRNQHRSMDEIVKNLLEKEKALEDISYSDRGVLESSDSENRGKLAGAYEAPGSYDEDKADEDVSGEASEGVSEKSEMEVYVSVKQTDFVPSPNISLTDSIGENAFNVDDEETDVELPTAKADGFTYISESLPHAQSELKAADIILEDAVADAYTLKGPFEHGTSRKRSYQEMSEGEVPSETDRCGEVGSPAAKQQRLARDIGMGIVGAIVGSAGMFWALLMSAPSN